MTLKKLVHFFITQTFTCINTSAPHCYFKQLTKTQEKMHEQHTIQWHSYTIALLCQPPVSGGGRNFKMLCQKRGMTLWCSTEIEMPYHSWSFTAAMPAANWCTSSAPMPLVISTQPRIYDFITTSCCKHHLCYMWNIYLMKLAVFQTFHFLAFFSPAYSSTAFWCRSFQSCILLSCIFSIPFHVSIHPATFYFIL